MRCLFIIIVITLGAFTSAVAQRLEVVDPAPKMMALQYENDFAAHTDYYYTQGIQLSYNNPKLSRFFLSKLLLKISADSVFGIAAEGDCFTPTSILSDTILKGDRPFAASIMAHYYRSSAKGRSRLASRLTIGIIGPAAGGYQLQKFIHENTDNPVPHGWQYQIRNDAIINYEVEGRTDLLSVPRRALISLTAIGRINAGTYLDKISAGLELKFGRFITDDQQSPFELYASAVPLFSLVGYDATLQGGIFNRSSPYTISARDVTRATFSNNFMLTAGWRRLKLKGSYTVLTKEFEQGKSHAWGGLTVIIGFK